MGRTRKRVFSNKYNLRRSNKVDYKFEPEIHEDEEFDHSGNDKDDDVIFLGSGSEGSWSPSSTSSSADPTFELNTVKTRSLRNKRCYDSQSESESDSGSQKSLMVIRTRQHSYPRSNQLYKKKKNLHAKEDSNESSAYAQGKEILLSESDSRECMNENESLSQPKLQGSSGDNLSMDTANASITVQNLDFSCPTSAGNHGLVNKNYEVVVQTSIAEEPEGILGKEGTSIISGVSSKGPSPSLPPLHVIKVENCGRDIVKKSRSCSPIVDNCSSSCSPMLDGSDAITGYAQIIATAEKDSVAARENVIKLTKLHMRNFLTAKDVEYDLTRVHYNTERDGKPSDLCAILLVLGQDTILEAYFKIAPSEYIMFGETEAQILATFATDIGTDSVRVRRTFENRGLSGILVNGSIFIQVGNENEIEVTAELLVAKLRNLRILVEDFMVDNLAWESMMDESCLTWWRRFKKIFSTEKRISGKAAQVEDIKKSLQSAELCVKKTNEYFSATVINYPNKFTSPGSAFSSVSAEESRALEVEGLIEDFLSKMLRKKVDMEESMRMLKVEYKEHYDTVRGTINDTFKKWIKKFNLKGSLVFDHENQRLIPYVYEGDQIVFKPSSDYFHKRWLKTSTEQKHICNFGVMLALSSISNSATIPFYIFDVASFEDYGERAFEIIKSSLDQVAATKINQQFIINLPGPRTTAASASTPAARASTAASASTPAARASTSGEDNLVGHHLNPKKNSTEMANQMRDPSSSSNGMVNGHHSEAGTSNGVTITREDVLELMNQRDIVDQQIHALGDILKANNIGMNEPLVDEEGFPRNDIDVYQVRHARVGIIRLQNDYKRISNEIEEKLGIYYEIQRTSGNSENGAMEIDYHAAQEPELQPIVKINLVSEMSPAYQAGLQENDLVLSFGSIDADNFRNIQDIGNLVQRSQGVILNVKVKRNNEIVKITLIPGPWSGRGLLGCNIVPIS